MITLSDELANSSGRDVIVSEDSSAYSESTIILWGPTEGSRFVFSGVDLEASRVRFGAERAAESRDVRSRMQKMAAIVRARMAASPRYADRPASIAEDEELMPGLQKLQSSALAED